MKFSAFISASAILSLASATPAAAAGEIEGVTPLPGVKIMSIAGANSTLADDHDHASLAKRQTRFGTIQFFSGGACDGGAGGVININDRNVICIDAQNRHSILVRDCRAFVGYYDRPGCPGNQYGSGSLNPNICYNVNTGKPWGSAKVYCPSNQPPTPHNKQ